jgi:hypothetical protein
VTWTTDASPTANTDSTVYTFEDVQLDLPTGPDSATVELRGQVDNANPGIDYGFATFIVNRKKSDFKIEVIDSTGSALAYSDITTGGGNGGATFYIRVTAETLGAGTTLTTFDGNVHISTAITGWPDDPQFTLESWYTAIPFVGDGTFLSTNDIPKVAFTSGVALVKATVTLPLAGLVSSYTHYCDIEIDAEEIV